MNNSNGKNNNNSSTANNNSVEFSELGEVKTALGRLYKEFESFKQSQKTERERDRAELQAWAQTNLIQNQLLSKAMVTIEMLTTELKTQNLSSNELEKNNADLMQQLTLFMSQLQNTPTSSPMLENLEFKGLRSEVAALKSNWNDLVSHTNRLTTVIQELRNTPPPKPITIEKEVYRSEPISKYGTIGMFTAFSTLSIFFILNLFIPVRISDDIHDYLQAIWQRTGFTNTKLQRVERYLGTDPKRRK
ncbi:hypothetical protein IQ278_26125 [Tolypothrix sp. LEGE 11397]|nr:hypothetical protein FDUTEX481_04235 [Tolypothrix sp. PCC 7601]MBE9085531.1 hypothetical protein [Tolypothrix sp. LEGE 11397]UYD31100.1 hypothetical protein HGR01_40340 [Tolypothrix sp. PCC 7712]UYD38904.1 hypothetical protein HG267_41185 [Tolypothrix sp. PCC 7601]BAY96070.1 hypothetical protein NIES3275_81470 [Microchaete diplosiphon NIES-3275]